MTNSEIKFAAKQNMRTQWGSLLLVLIIVAVLCAAANIIPVIGALAVSGPLCVGQAYAYYKASKMQTVELEDTFKGFKYCFGDSLLLGILKSIFIFLWSLLFVIPGIIKGYSYSMSEYIMMREGKMDALEAINKSKAMMDGHKMDMFMLDLKFLGWLILCCLTLGILLIYVAPWFESARTLFMNQIYEASSIATAKTAEAAPQAAEAQQAPDVIQL